MNADRSQSSPGKSGSKAMSVVRSLGRAPILLRRHIWTWPIVAAVVLGIVGWFLRGAIEHELRLELESKLVTIRSAEVEALDLWMESRKDAVHTVVEDDSFRELALMQLAVGERDEVTTVDLLGSPVYESLQESVGEHVDRHEFDGFLLATPRGLIVASRRPAPVGMVASDDDSRSILERMDDGRPIVTKPYRSTIALEDARGETRGGVPTMFAGAAVRDDEGEIAGYLLLRIRPWDRFTKILQIARVGESGETYAFDENGLMLSKSRFDEQMRREGILGSTEDSILVLQTRDPGGDMTRGHRPSVDVADRPLTKSAAGAIAREAGVSTEAYRDYRGVPVVGAWSWVEGADFGIATEIDAEEAFRPIHIMRMVFWTMFALLALASVAIFVFTILVERANREAREAALEAKQLGQYQLEEELGRGGMGVVYRAHHEMLRRPTAVKFLDADKTNDQSIARFEREVQATSRLTHPNTIAIYDYGRSPEGIFYYAMEYLEGVDLGDLVREHGPQPPARVVHLLTQIAGSLAEAHAIGLVHRDIKPANVMLTMRGGIADFVKVLDFGLVKLVDDAEQATLTAAGAVTGTPLYMSPESVRDRARVDGRADLYAVGAVGYYLLTGSPPFDKGSALEILRQHIEDDPQPPSARLGRTIDRDLESIVLTCLAKSPADRPASAAELIVQLEACEAAKKWTREDAMNWWREHGERWSIDPDRTYESLEESTTIANRRGLATEDETAADLHAPAS